jgi:hypothetical protein
MGTLPKFVFRLTDYHVICPSYPIALRLSLKVFFDTIFPGVPLTFVSLSGPVHTLHAQEDTRADLTVSTYHRIFLEQTRDCFCKWLYALHIFGLSQLVQYILPSTGVLISP